MRCTATATVLNEIPEVGGIEDESCRLESGERVPIDVEPYHSGAYSDRSRSGRQCSATQIGPALRLSEVTREVEAGAKVRHRVRIRDADAMCVWGCRRGDSGGGGEIGTVKERK